MIDFIFGELLFDCSWTQTPKAIKLRNPITDGECWIPKAAIMHFTRLKAIAQETGYLFPQNIYLKKWFVEKLRHEKNDPHNEDRFKAGATYNQINRPRKYYILEKIKQDEEFKKMNIAPTGLP